jgi:putative nucleic acid modification protein with dual OB domain
LPPSARGGVFAALMARSVDFRRSPVRHTRSIARYPYMQILVNHLTRMHGGHICMAGLDPDQRHIRPVPASGRLGTQLAHEYGGPVRIGAVVELGSIRPRPDPPEVEDAVFAPSKLRPRRVAERHEFWQVLEAQAARTFAEIFGASLKPDGRTASMAAGIGNRSLGVYRPRGPVSVDHAYGKLRVSLRDPEIGALSIPLTDLRLYDMEVNLVHVRRVELLVDRLRRRDVLLSVGVSRPWSRSGGEPDSN